MHLDCYKVHKFVPEIVPGSAGREWMDTFQDRQPYRCLPLTMANSALLASPSNGMAGQWRMQSC